MAYWFLMFLCSNSTAACERCPVLNTTAPIIQQVCHCAGAVPLMRGTALILSLISDGIRHAVWMCVCASSYSHEQVRASAAGFRTWILTSCFSFQQHNSKAGAERVCLCADAGQETFAPFMLPLTPLITPTPTRPANGRGAQEKRK